jgi:type IV pilus biogenesis protein PilP
MHYDIRKILCSTALAVVMGFAASNDAFAQGVVSLADDGLPIESENDNFSAPELALFDEVDDSNDIIEIRATSTETTAKEAAEVPLEGSASGSSDEASSPLLGGNASEGSNGGGNASLPGLLGESEVSLGGSSNAPTVGASPLLPGGTGGTAATTTTTTTVVKIEKDDLADKLIAKSNDTLFSQMSDLERQTTLLTLELRREKIKSEIEAIRAQRRRAEEEERAYQEEKERKQKEWENEQKRLILIEEQKIIELEIAMEKERQERIVKAYKETMLKENQKWIDNSEKVYKVLQEVENDRDELYENVKGKINSIHNYSLELLSTAQKAKENHTKKVEELQLQNAVLKARLAAAEAEKRASKINPFAEDGENFMEPEIDQPRMNHEYVVMEIRGQGDELIARLMNKDKKTFIVKEGTTLQTGHKIDEITRNYVRGELNGYKDFLYLSVGTAIEIEPNNKVEKEIKESSKNAKAQAAAAAANAAASGSGSGRSPSLRRRTINVNRGVPSVSSGLMVK